MTYAIWGGTRAVANDEHLALLRQGSAVWNEWRERTGFIRPDLSWADLGPANLDCADLSFGDLTGANLNEATLIGANLLHADLSGAHLISAKILHSNLTNAKLQFATLIGARLSYADLSGAFLHWADLSGAVLRGAVLRGAVHAGANLVRANFRQADLNRANLNDAKLSGTIFGDVDLAKTIGLDNCKHDGPSIIDFLTLSRSSNVPISFLRGCSLPDILIDYLPSLRDNPIQFYSCFISYSTKDKVFADRLHADLENRGVRCWFAPHHMPIGAKPWEATDQATRLRDKLLVILSQAALDSGWVGDEVSTAFAEEAERKRTILLPIQIDDAVMTTQEPWARKLRQRHIGDFREWRKPTEYQNNLERLLRDLRARGNT